MNNEIKKNSFGWSLNPLEWVTRLAVGTSINVFHTKCFSSARNIYWSPISLGFILLFGCSIIIANLVINGPRGINIFNFDWMKRIQNYDSPFLYFKDEPDAILQFVMDVTSICFFIALPLIQFIYLWTSRSSNWTRLILSLKMIKNEMKLSNQLYQKCRNKCIISILLLILVYNIRQIYLKTINPKFHSLKDAVVFSWKYSFYDCNYVADERWQKLKWTNNWLPMTVRDPLPFMAALWARIAEIGVVNVFCTMTLVAALLFEDLNNRAEEMSQDYNTAQYSANLEDWRRHYNLVCRFVEKINDCFGLILLIEVALVFSVPIFEFHKMFLTNWRKPRYYFEFGHSVIRFLLMHLIPSYTVTQKVWQILFYSIPITLKLYSSHERIT